MAEQATNSGGILSGFFAGIKGAFNGAVNTGKDLLNSAPSIAQGLQAIGLIESEQEKLAKIQGKYYQSTEAIKSQQAANTTKSVAIIAGVIVVSLIAILALKKKG